jgi:hypothetical protein
LSGFATAGVFPAVPFSQVPADGLSSVQGASHDEQRQHSQRLVNPELAGSAAVAGDDAFGVEAWAADAAVWEPLTEKDAVADSASTSGERDRRARRRVRAAANMPAGVDVVPLQQLAARLDCSPAAVAELLAEVAGVRVDVEAGVAWLVDRKLGEAVKVAFAGEPPPRSDRWWKPKTMQELGLNPASTIDCEWYERYSMALEASGIDYEIKKAEIDKADAEASWLESMADVIDYTIIPSSISEEAGEAAIAEVEEKVARFRVERGYDPPLPRLGDALLVDLAAALRVRAVHAQRGSTRAPRSRARSTAAASRDGPRRSSDEPDAHRLVHLLRREAA